MTEFNIWILIMLFFLHSLRPGRCHVHVYQLPVWLCKTCLSLSYLFFIGLGFQLVKICERLMFFSLTSQWVISHSSPHHVHVHSSEDTWNDRKIFFSNRFSLVKLHAHKHAGPHFCLSIQIQKSTSHRLKWLKNSAEMYQLFEYLFLCFPLLQIDFPGQRCTQAHPIVNLILRGNNNHLPQRAESLQISIQPKTAPGDSFFLCSWWSANLWNNLLQSLAGMKTCSMLALCGPFLPLFIQTVHTDCIYYFVEKWQFCLKLLGTLLGNLKGKVFHLVTITQYIKMTDVADWNENQQHVPVGTALRKN